MHISDISGVLSVKYNLNTVVFLWVYITSIIPLYSGVFIMIHGSAKHISFSEIIRLRLGQLEWNSESKIGLFILTFGFLMPYAYIVIYGKNLPWWIYCVLVFLCLLSIIWFFKKINFRQKRTAAEPQVITIKDTISDIIEAKDLWSIYNGAFEKLNRVSPCRQSFTYEHFLEILKEPSVKKYIMTDKLNGNIIGLGMISNNFKNSPWISEDYFKEKFPDQYNSKLVYYFLGIVVHDDYKKRGHSLSLLNSMGNDIPVGAIMGFDHSHNINPFLYDFVKRVKKSKDIKRVGLDRQHYYIIYF